MKKILSIAGAIALAASLFVACSSEAADDGRNSYIDTYSLDAVDITVKAYPGFNYVSWGIAKKGGTVKVLRDDGFDVSTAAGTNNFYVDSNVKNDVTYKYTAYTVAAGNEVKSANDNVTGTATNTAANEYKTYWAVSGNSKSASAKAIGLDHYNSKGELTTALDLTNCTNAGDKKYVISDKNLIYKKVTDEIGTDHLYVSFPTKAYLKYEVFFYKGNSFDTYYAERSVNGSYTAFGVKNDTIYAGFASGTGKGINIDQNFYKMDATANKDVIGLGAGTWKAVVKVTDYASTYVPSYVFAKDTVTIDAVDTTGAFTTLVNRNISTTGNISNGYIDSGKTIRIVWKPAQNANNKEWATTNYKVYVADGVNNKAANYTALTGEIKTDKQLNETVYYTEYAVTDNTAPYTFWVVLSDNGKLETTVPSVTVEKYADKAQVNWIATKGTPAVAYDTYSATFADKDNDGVTNDAVLTLNVPSNADENKSALITVKSVKYKIVAPNDNTYYTSEKLLLDSEVKEVAAHPTADYTKYEAIVKDVTIGSSVVFLYTLQQADRADLIVVKPTTGSSTGASLFAANEFYYVDSDESATEHYKFKFTVIPGGRGVAGEPANFDAKENYTYKLYFAKVADGASIASITSWEEISLSVAWKTDLTVEVNGVAGNAWAAVAEKDVSGLFEDAYKPTLDSSNGKKDKDGKGANIVFKYVKTSKAGVSSVAYSSIESGKKN